MSAQGKRHFFCSSVADSEEMVDFILFQPVSDQQFEIKRVLFFARLVSAEQIRNGISGLSRRLIINFSGNAMFGHLIPGAVDAGAPVPDCPADGKQDRSLAAPVQMCIRDRAG